MEDCSCNEAVEKTNDGIVDVPEGADANLHDKNEDDGNEDGEESSQPDGDNLFTQWVCKIRKDDFTIDKVDREGSGRRRRSFVDLAIRSALWYVSP